eukprot:10385259-Lingulodinium_polyedra.AAC.1
MASSPSAALTTPVKKNNRKSYTPKALSEVQKCETRDCKAQHKERLQQIINDLQADNELVDKVFSFVNCYKRDKELRQTKDNPE